MMIKYQSAAEVVGRVLISLIFLLSGLNKISAYEGVQGYMESVGVPGVLLPIVILAEVALSLFVMVGWKTRYAAFAYSGASGHPYRSIRPPMIIGCEA